MTRSSDSNSDSRGPYIPFSLTAKASHVFGTKPRHIAVVALVGWSLIGPPLNDTGNIVASAPLYSWKIMASFNTAAECTSNLKLLQKEVSAARKSQSNPSSAAVLESASY